MEAIRTRLDCRDADQFAASFFCVRPALECAGSGGAPEAVPRILCESARDKAAQLALTLESDNDRRRALTTRVEEEAIAAIKGFADLNSRGAFVLANEQWDEGVLGIAAARVVNSSGAPPF
jgi:single-stranded-DNA-specific exonuclease